MPGSLIGFCIKSENMCVKKQESRRKEELYICPPRSFGTHVIILFKPLDDRQHIAIFETF
jgi:hypothetical protein